jgi:hypothetical protein
MKFNKKGDLTSEGLRMGKVPLQCVTRGYPAMAAGKKP